MASATPEIYFLHSLSGGQSKFNIFIIAPEGSGSMSWVGHGFASSVSTTGNWTRVTSEYLREKLPEKLQSSYVLLKGKSLNQIPSGALSEAKTKLAEYSPGGYLSTDADNAPIWVAGITSSASPQDAPFRKPSSQRFEVWI